VASPSTLIFHFRPFSPVILYSFPIPGIFSYLANVPLLQEDIPGLQLRTLSFLKFFWSLSRNPFAESFPQSALSDPFVRLGPLLFKSCRGNLLFADYSSELTTSSNTFFFDSFSYNTLYILPAVTFNSPVFPSG